MALLSSPTFLALCVLSTSAFDIRFAAASPDAPAVDVLVNDQLPTKFTNIQFRSVSKYIHLTQGMYNYKVVPTGKRTPVYLNFNQTINHDHLPFTIAIASKLASVKRIVFGDDRARPRRGYSALRFVHLSPDSPAVDFRISGQSKPLFTNIAFGAASNYQEIPHGDYTIQLLKAGSHNVMFETKVKLLQDVATSVFAEGMMANLDVTITRDI